MITALLISNLYRKNPFFFFLQKLNFLFGFPMRLAAFTSSQSLRPFFLLPALLSFSLLSFFSDKDKIKRLTIKEMQYYPGYILMSLFPSRKLPLFKQIVSFLKSGKRNKKLNRGFRGNMYRESCVELSLCSLLHFNDPGWGGDMKYCSLFNVLHSHLHIVYLLLLRPFRCIGNCFFSSIIQRKCTFLQRNYRKLSV